MENIDIYKKRLEDELEKLKGELDKLGIQNKNKDGEWDLTSPDLDIMNADQNEEGDRNEEYHIDSIILDELSTRYKNIVRALKKIENNTYGICEVGNDHEIEKERLDANPAARTCKKHIGQMEGKE